MGSVLSPRSSRKYTYSTLPVTETIFGMREHFPISQGQEMKHLTVLSGHKAETLAD
jgi:hypothetical protein